MLPLRTRSTATYDGYTQGSQVRRATLVVASLWPAGWRRRWACSSPRGRRRGSLIGSRSVILIGLAAMFVGCLSLLWAGVGTPFGELVIQQMVLAAGIGLLVPQMTSSLMGSVDRARSGVAAGTLNTMRQTGSVLGVAVFGSLVSARFTSGLHVALVMSMVLIVAGAAVMAGPDGAGALPRLRSAFGKWSRSAHSEP
jgi:hypothetical protein